jgi:hypothetical protein
MTTTRPGSAKPPSRPRSGRSSCNWAKMARGGHRRRQLLRQAARSGSTTRSVRTGTFPLMTTSTPSPTCAPRSAPTPTDCSPCARVVPQCEAHEGRRPHGKGHRQIPRSQPCDVVPVPHRHSGVGGWRGGYRCLRRTSRPRSDEVLVVACMHAWHRPLR